MHLYNYGCADHKSMKRNLQVVEDIKFLVMQTQLVLKETTSEAKKIIYDISRSSFNAMKQIRVVHGGSRQDSVVPANEK